METDVCLPELFSVDTVLQCCWLSSVTFYYNIPQSRSPLVYKFLSTSSLHKSDENSLPSLIPKHEEKVEYKLSAYNMSTFLKTMNSANTVYSINKEFMDQSMKKSSCFLLSRTQNPLLLSLYDKISQELSTSQQQMALTSNLITPYVDNMRGRNHSFVNVLYCLTKYLLKLLAVFKV